MTHEAVSEPAAAKADPAVSGPAGANAGPASARDAQPLLSIEQTFAADRERVFDAWIRPDLLEQWFAPTGCTLRIARHDVRPGGSFHWCIRHPEFGDCWSIGTYLEVVRPERLKYTWTIADATGSPVSPESQGHEPSWPRDTMVTVTFTERAGQTHVALEQTVSESLARRTGAYPSWLQMFDRLHQNLATPSK
jgi:uncharacterized protein YndB with AHSA1/START domain